MALNEKNRQIRQFENVINAHFEIIANHLLSKNVENENERIKFNQHFGTIVRSIRSRKSVKDVYQLIKPHIPVLIHFNHFDQFCDILFFTDITLISTEDLEEFVSACFWTPDTSRPFFDKILKKFGQLSQFVVEIGRKVWARDPDFGYEILDVFSELVYTEDEALQSLLEVDTTRIDAVIFQGRVDLEMLLRRAVYDCYPQEAIAYLKYKMGHHDDLVSSGSNADYTDNEDREDREDREDDNNSVASVTTDITMESSDSEIVYPPYLSLRDLDEDELAKPMLKDEYEMPDYVLTGRYSPASPSETAKPVGDGFFRWFG